MGRTQDIYLPLPSQHLRQQQIERSFNCKSNLGSFGACNCRPNGFIAERPVSNTMFWVKTTAKYFDKFLTQKSGFDVCRQQQKLFMRRHARKGTRSLLQKIFCCIKHLTIRGLDLCGRNGDAHLDTTATRANFQTLFHFNTLCSQSLLLLIFLTQVVIIIL